MLYITKNFLHLNLLNLQISVVESSWLQTYTVSNFRLDEQNNGNLLQL